mmetsp:Transcript_15913/g.24565  ORF Transcript_15913/g.24565 Transcript_15913/m.24565 type:complete len:168 (-) Transcript_15913:671-1174(-)
MTPVHLQLHAKHRNQMSLPDDLKDPNFILNLKLQQKMLARQSYKEILERRLMPKRSKRTKSSSKKTMRSLDISRSLGDSGFVNPPKIITINYKEEQKRKVANNFRFPHEKCIRSKRSHSKKKKKKRQVSVAKSGSGSEGLNKMSISRDVSNSKKRPMLPDITSPYNK